MLQRIIKQQTDSLGVPQAVYASTLNHKLNINKNFAPDFKTPDDNIHQTANDTRELKPRTSVGIEDIVSFRIDNIDISDAVLTLNTQGLILINYSTISDGSILNLHHTIYEWGCVIFMVQTIENAVYTKREHDQCHVLDKIKLVLFSVGLTSAG